MGAWYPGLPPVICGFCGVQYESSTQLGLSRKKERWNQSVTISRSSRHEPPLDVLSAPRNTLSSPV